MKLKNKHHNKAGYLGLLFFSTVCGAWATEEYDDRRTLDQFVELAEKQGSALSESLAQIEQAKARVDGVEAKGLPQGTLMALVGPSPGASGDALNGRTNWDKWGPFTSFQLEILQPLYTFGALSHAQDAAKSGLAAQEQLHEKNRWALRSDVAKYYYGYQLAFEFKEFTDDILEKLSKALEDGTSLRRQGKHGAPTQMDLDQLKVYVLEAESRQEESTQSQNQVREAMAWKVGLTGKKIPRWDQSNLKKRELSKIQWDILLAKTKELRPEMKALKLNVSAHDDLVKMNSSLSLPTLFIAGRATYSIAQNRTKQSSPFAYDPLNDTSAGIALGVKIDLDFFQKSADRSKARAELMEAEGKEKYYSAGIETEVRKNYLEVNKLQNIWVKREEAAKLAKRIFYDAIVGFGLGTVSPKQALDTLGLYVSAEKNRLETLYQYNLSVCELEASVGTKL